MKGFVLSRPTLWTPMDCSPTGFSAHGILQARILEWVAMPSSRGSSQLRDQTRVSYVSCIADRLLLLRHLGNLIWKANGCKSLPQPWRLWPSLLFPPSPGALILILWQNHSFTTGSPIPRETQGTKGAPWLVWDCGKGRWGRVAGPGRIWTEVPRRPWNLHWGREERASVSLMPHPLSSWVPPAISETPLGHPNHPHVHACMLSCIWLFETLWTATLQAPLITGFSRQEYWSGLPFPPPGDLLTQIKLCVSYPQSNSKSTGTRAAANNSKNVFTLVKTLCVTHHRKSTHYSKKGHTAAPVFIDVQRTCKTRPQVPDSGCYWRRASFHNSHFLGALFPEVLEPLPGSLPISSVPAACSSNQLVFREIK